MAKIYCKICQKSSIYAVSRIGFSKSNNLKVFWFVVLVVCLSACAYNTHEFYSVYFEYPVIVSLQEEQIVKPHFPAVTICNLNRMKRSYEHCDYDDGGCYEEEEDKNKPKIPTDQGMSERRSLLSCNGNDTSKEISMAKLNFILKYLRMNDENRKSVDYEASELVENCSFNMQLCSWKDFEFFQSLRFGNCYTINNSNRKNNQYFNFLQAGQRSELDLVLSVGVFEYASTSSKLGMRITVHHASEVPNPERNGFDISPGFETSVVLKQMAFQRLPAPYRGECINYTSRVNESSQHECMKLCLQKLNFKICGCIDPTLVLISRMKHCRITNMTEVCCLDTVQDNITREELPCNCPPSCYSISYNYEISKAALPKSRNKIS